MAPAHETKDSPFSPPFIGAGATFLAGIHSSIGGWQRHDPSYVLEKNFFRLSCIGKAA